MNWKIVLADDSGSFYELFLLGYSRADAILEAWEAVGDDADNLILVESLPDEELPYIDPACAIRADGLKHPQNKYRGSLWMVIGGENHDETDPR